MDDRLAHDYDSAHKGGNRYSTILLYFTDLGEHDGGETVFTEAWPVGQSEEDHVPFETVRICPRTNIRLYIDPVDASNRLVIAGTPETSRFR